MVLSGDLYLLLLGLLLFLIFMDDLIPGPALASTTYKFTKKRVKMIRERELLIKIQIRSKN